MLSSASYAWRGWRAQKVPTRSPSGMCRNAAPIVSTKHRPTRRISRRYARMARPGCVSRTASGALRTAVIFSPEISMTIVRWCARTWRRCAPCSIARMPRVSGWCSCRSNCRARAGRNRTTASSTTDCGTTRNSGARRARSGATWQWRCAVIRRSWPTTSSTSRCRSCMGGSTNTPRPRPCATGINARVARRATCRDSMSCC